jgi:hypothetical protein
MTTGSLVAISTLVRLSSLYSTVRPLRCEQASTHHVLSLQTALTGIAGIKKPASN